MIKKCIKTYQSLIQILLLLSSQSLLFKNLYHIELKQEQILIYLCITDIEV